MRRTLLGVTVAAAGLTVLTGDSTGYFTAAPAAPPAAAGVSVLQDELDAMARAGLRPDYPKAKMLQADLDALQQGMVSTSPTEVDVDVPGMIARGTRARTDAAEDLVDDGEVLCEPIPPDHLTAADIAGATCSSAPQPDGSSLYVATRPDHSRIVVRFGPDGSITRRALGASGLGARPAAP
jgi:hypothetical protein